MPRSTAAKCSVPRSIALGRVTSGDRLRERGVLLRRLGDDPVDRVAVLVTRQHGADLVGVEQACHHLAVHLDEQRIAAGAGDHRVEHVIERAERLELHARVESCRELADLLALFRRRPLGGEADHR